MTIHEPATLFTDLLLAGFAGWLAWRLARRFPSQPAATVWWRRVLGLTAVSAFVGGCYHGFAPEFSPAAQHVWWLTTLVLVVAATVAAWLYPRFVIVVMDYGLVLLAWTVAALVCQRPWRNGMLAALALSLLAAAVQQLHVSPTAAFNHNDLYHVLQLLALFGFYRAAQRFTGPR